MFQLTLTIIGYFINISIYNSGTKNLIHSKFYYIFTVRHIVWIGNKGLREIVNIIPNLIQTVK